jgi:hypothetical protein
MIASLFLSLGGLGLLGGGWFVAALFFAPAASLLKSTLDFLRSPLGTALGVIALALFLYVAGWIAGDVHGSNATRADWRADNAAKAKAAEARSIALNVEMSGIVGAALGHDDQFGKIIDQKVHDYVAKTPAVACRRATGDDIVRLRAIE